jgi:hypothetical protein
LARKGLNAELRLELSNEHGYGETVSEVAAQPRRGTIETSVAAVVDRRDQNLFRFSEIINYTLKIIENCPVSLEILYIYFYFF